MTPKWMLAGALLLLSVVTQPSLSSPQWAPRVLMMRQASPLLYPASYPSTSSQVTLNNGLYSPWSSFYYPSVINQRNAAPAAPQATAVLQDRGNTNAKIGCGDWTSSVGGCYKHFGTEQKTWKEAREHCRAEGLKEGVSNADLAYFDTTEQEKVIQDLDLTTSVEKFWLNGKLTSSGAVTLKGFNWEPVDPRTKWIGDRAPTFDLNAKLYFKNLFIKPDEKKLGVDLGRRSTKKFICEFKKRVCKDSTWIFDSENTRCLKVFSEEKTYKKANETCEAETSDSTLASLVPTKGTKLKDLTRTHFGTWVLESASKDAGDINVKYTKPKRGPATGSDPVTIAPSYILDAFYKDELTTAPKHLALDSAGGLFPVFDSTAKARFICEHATTSSGTTLKFDVQQAGAANEPLERSLLSFNPNV